jgi:hypothetical protein
MGLIVNINETKALLKEIADIDNRKLDEAMAKGWHAVLSPIPLEIAREAHILARRDATITYLEPKHIVAWSKEAAFRLDRDKKKPEPTPTGDPMPVCRDHGKSILGCDPCCHRLYKFTEARGFEGLERFARAEIYA